MFCYKHLVLSGIYLVTKTDSRPTALCKNSTHLRPSVRCHDLSCPAGSFSRNLSDVCKVQARQTVKL